MLISILLTAAPTTAAPFRSTETNLFTFYYKDTTRKAARFLMERADEHARAISAELGFPVRGRIKAYIVNSFDEFLNRH
ncbi:MAG: hypothetical protein GY868_17240, partial [Deltaproteobacteria bacterium]|nr:hypothetical protein [Deltaproteobacteria bacterium]